MKTKTKIPKFEKRKEVLFRWWSNDKKAIPKKHLEELEECANERIREMTAQGYQSGELCASIYSHRTGQETEYRGWWDVKELDPEEETPKP